MKTRLFDMMQVLSRIRPYVPNTRMGQIIILKKGKKRFQARVIQPNYSGGSLLTATANGKTFNCFHLSGNEWGY